ncbi:MAG: azurin [Flavobacteriaceae bacterium]|nr:azurin [Flavobacteriaceae bacterium]
MKIFRVLIVLVIVAFGCNTANKTPEAENTTKIMTNEVTKPTDIKVKGVNEVFVSSNDQMQFDKTEIRVKSGHKVTLTLRHKGMMSKIVMGHNFVLLNKGVDLVKFAQKALSAQDHNYVPLGSKDVLAYTKIIGGGERVSITFDAPEKGTYDFLCSFPGHYAMMKGKFIVE